MCNYYQLPITHAQLKKTDVFQDEIYDNQINIAIPPMNVYYSI